MDEREWLGSDDPAELMEWLMEETIGELWAQPLYPNSPSDRKLRLIAIAIARHGGCGSWASVGYLIQGAERMAEGLPHDLSSRDIEQAQQYVAGWLVASYLGDTVWTILEHYEPDVEDRETGLIQAAIIRDIVGNPFRPVEYRLSQSCHEAHGWAKTLAQAAYDERLPDGTLDPVRLAILADAMEDAGCDSEDILRSLRGEQPYFYTATWSTDGPGYEGQTMSAWKRLRCPRYRGSWVLDLILEKE